MKQRDSSMHGNTLGSVSSLPGVLEVSAPKGEVDTKAAAAAEVTSISCVREGQEGTWLSPQVFHTYTGPQGSCCGLSQHCLTACATFLGTAGACTTPQMSCGHGLELPLTGAPSSKQGPLPWWGLSYLHTHGGDLCCASA